MCHALDVVRFPHEMKPSVGAPVPDLLDTDTFILVAGDEWRRAVHAHGDAVASLHESAGKEKQTPHRATPALRSLEVKDVHLLNRTGR